MAEKDTNFQLFLDDRFFVISDSEDLCFNFVNGIGTRVGDIDGIDELFNLFEKSSIPEFYVHTETPGLALSRLLEKNQFIRAAGGIVSNREGDILLMTRMGYADFPKGKIEADETEISAARREIEEECGIANIEMKEKIMDTYHIYYQNARIIKCTAWFMAKYYGNQVFVPQTEEGITDVRWISRDSMHEYLPEMYASLKQLVKKYYELTSK